MIRYTKALMILFGLSRKVSGRSTALAALELVGGAAGMLTALFIGKLVGALIVGQITIALLMAIALCVCLSSQWLLGLVGTQSRITLAEKIGAAVDDDLAAQLSSLKTIDYHSDPAIQDKLELITQQKALLGAGMSGILWALNLAVSSAVVLIAAGLVDARLLLLSLTAIPALLGANLRARWDGAAEQTSAPLARQLRSLTSMVLLDSSSGLDVRLHASQHRVAHRLQTMVRAWRTPLRSSSTRGVAILFAEDVLFSATVAVISVWIILSNQGTGATATAVVVAVLSARQIQKSVVDMARRLGSVDEIVRNVERYSEILDFVRDSSAGTAESANMPMTLGRIELRDVSYRYSGAKVEAISNINLVLDEGETVAFVGENGSGKTTLTNLILGLLEPASGTIKYGTDQGRSVSYNEWLESTTGAFQDHSEFEFSVLNNVGVGSLPDVDDHEKVRRAVEQTSRSDFLKDLPMGLDTQLGTRWAHGVSLSGGEWQRLSLARGTMRTDARLRVLDEPTSALDADNEDRLMKKYVGQHAETVITLIVTHRLASASYADKIILLSGGRIAESGKHEELLSRNGQYAQMYEIQSKGYLGDD